MTWPTLTFGLYIYAIVTLSAKVSAASAGTYVISIPVAHQVARYRTEELREHLTIDSGSCVQQVHEFIRQWVRHTSVVIYIRLVLIRHRCRTHESGNMFVA